MRQVCQGTRHCLKHTTYLHMFHKKWALHARIKTESACISHRVERKLWLHVNFSLFHRRTEYLFSITFFYPMKREKREKSWTRRVDKLLEFIFNEFFLLLKPSCQSLELLVSGKGTDLGSKIRRYQQFLHRNYFKKSHLHLSFVIVADTGKTNTKCQNKCLTLMINFQILHGPIRNSRTKIILITLNSIVISCFNSIFQTCHSGFIDKRTKENLLWLLLCFINTILFWLFFQNLRTMYSGKSLFSTD